jgi:adenylate cyclase
MGWGAKKTAETFTRARELCTLLGESGQLPPILNGEYMHELSIGRFRAAREVAGELLRFGEDQHDAEAIIQGHRILGWGNMYLGEFSVSQTHVDEALRLYDPQQHGRLKLRYAHDTQVAVLCVRAITQCLCGYPDQGNETTRETISCARSIDHEPTLAYALTLAGALTAAMQGDPQKTAEFSEEILVISKRLSSSVWLGYGRAMYGWSACMRSLDDHHLQLFHEGLESLKSTAPNPWQPLFLSLRAKIYIRSGETDRALRALESALQLVERTDERMWESGVYNLLGNALLAQDSPNTQRVEANFRKSIEIARNQGAKSLELSAATSLARLWQSQGKRQEARNLLEPVYNWFTEGFDTPDLVKARELLEELA